jgi:small subunit ribosomal protein S6
MSNKLRNYELIYLVHRDATEEDLNGLSDRLTKALDAFDGNVVKQESWGKRRLAYEIKKGLNTYQKAFYEYMILEGRPGMTQELERILRLSDLCIRFMTIKLDQLPVAVEEPAEEIVEA